jgi:hypothetical protein
MSAAQEINMLAFPGNAYENDHFDLAPTTPFN